MNALAISYKRDKAALLDGAPLGNSRSVRTLLKALSQLTDHTLQQLWLDAGFDHHLALAAVGGYGRGELYPNSDVDVLLLLPNGTSAEDDETLKSQIEKFIGNCWDTGLEIGSSVRTVDECVQEASADITVQTSLLEARLICGDAVLFKTFQARFDAAMDPQAFFVAKTLELR